MDLVTPDNGTDQEKSVIDTTVQGDARVQPEHVITATIASDANNQDITRKIATSKLDLLYGMKPKYLHYNVWSDEESTDKSNTLPMICLADWTECAKPLPDMPATEQENQIVLKTIADRPDLFKIITPINVDRFEELLRTHPNQPFVNSVCQGLRESFWPWADTK